jgi:serine/threonine protein kinase/Flp pilus assembly protein TadD
MDTERDLLFGVLAMQADLINAEQLTEVYGAEASQKTLSLADQLEARGWINRDERAEVERTLERKLRKHGGDPQATLLATAGDQVRTVLASVGDPSVQATLSTTSAAASGHVLITTIGTTENRDRYTLTRLHAKGGIGQVWLARDEDLGRDVALKELRPERIENPVVWARFLEEARITGQLEHPSIVPIYELTRRKDHQPFYTMRFVRGRTLTEAIRDYHQKRKQGQARPLDLAHLLNAFVAVCNAIAYAHSRGVIHRDLKGQNIVLGDFGEVMVLDWGLAKLVGRPDEPFTEPPVVLHDAAHEPTMQGQVLGTPAYMAPEQAEGRLDRVGRHSDIYSLGAILYEILTDVPPFIGQNTADLLRRVREELPPRPRQINPTAPTAVEAICLKAMAKQAEERYESATELAEEIRRWLADEPVTAYPERWYVRFSRWSRRHKTAVTVAGVLLATAVVTLAITNVLIGHERNEARRQREQARQAVDEMYTEVATKWLEDRGELDSLQRRFLEKALAYYERFAEEDASDPTVRQERCRAYQRVGDILRKLGRKPQAERAYRSALRLQKALAQENPRHRDYQYQWALDNDRLADLLVKFDDPSKSVEAEPLYRQSVELLTRLIARSPGGARSYQIALAKTKKSLADLLRKDSRTKQAAEATYREAIQLLEPTLVAGSDDPEPPLALAATFNALGSLQQRDLGQRDAAEQSYRRSLALLEELLSQSISTPTFREDLAESHNSLYLFLLAEGKTAEAEPALRRSLELYERLVADYPRRPEYRRKLVRAYSNLGMLLQKEGRLDQAERAYQQANQFGKALVAEDANDIDCLNDLARALNNLGELLAKLGHAPAAEAAYRRSWELYDRLATGHLHQPSYLQSRAGVEMNLGVLLDSQGRKADADLLYQRAIDGYKTLVAEVPANPELRQELARSLNNLGTILAEDRPQAAEDAYLEAIKLLGQLVVKFPKVPDYRRDQASWLSNRGELRRKHRLPGAEADFRQALAIFEKLVDDFPKVPDYRLGVAVAQLNLGEWLQSQDQLAQAEENFRAAIQGFEALVGEVPKAPDFQSYLGYALEDLGKLLLAKKDASQARALLERAVRSQRAALAVNPGSAGYRQLLQGHLTALGQALIALGGQDDDARQAEEFLRGISGPAAARFDAAVLFASCAGLMEDSTQLPEPERKARARAYADRAVALLREAVEHGDRVTEWIKDDVFKPLRSRDDFQRLEDEAGRIAKPQQNGS